MPIFEAFEIDWTAFAAITALVIWLVDGYRRRKERRASARLLAQIMLTPVGVAQIEIAKLRSVVVPPGGGDTKYLFDVLDSQTGRKDLASRASLVTLDLLPQFLDKADLFSEIVSNRLAWAFSQINRLRSLSQLLGDMPDSADEEEIAQHVKVVLTQIQETEQAIGEAFQALLNEGRSSTRLRRPNPFPTNGFKSDQAEYFMDYRVCASGMIKDTGTIKGRGVFAIRQIRAGEIIEVCPVILLPTDWNTMPDEVKHRVFDWGHLIKGSPAPCIALGWGSMYNHRNPANIRYSADNDTLSIMFTAARDIELGEELTVNYNGAGGNIDSSEDDWFDDTGISPI